MRTFAVIGVGGQGTSIAPMALNEGHRLLGGVDVGEKVGRPLRELIDHPLAPDNKVFGSIDELIAAEGKPEVALLAASIPLEQEAEISVGLLEQGINVLTLEPTLFEGGGDIAERLDAAGKAGGATILSTGIQDILWVHLPALAAAANTRITQVSFDDVADCSFWSREEGVYEAGIGLGDEEFADWVKPQLAAPPVQGGPLRELARLLGFTPGEMTHEIEPIRLDVPVTWTAADVVLEPGTIVGAAFRVAFPTAEGPLFTGTLRFLVSEGGPEISANSVRIAGDANIVVQVPLTDPFHLVAVGPVRRIPDVVDAPPGLVRARDLPAPRYARAPAAVSASDVRA